MPERGDDIRPTGTRGQCGAAGDPGILLADSMGAFVGGLVSGKLQCDNLAVVGEVREVVVPGAAGAGGGARHVIAVDIVRPDDDTFTQPLLEGSDEVGEGVSSEISSEVVPHGADLAVVVTPRRPAQCAGVALGHVTSPVPIPPSICTATCHMASIMVPSLSIDSPRTPRTSSWRPGSV